MSRCADRIVRLRNGVIESEERLRNLPGKRGDQGARMKLWKLSLRQAQSRPGRVVLTLFSVVIGVAATVSVSLSIATTRPVYQKMSEAMVGRAGVEVAAAAGGTLNEDILPILEKTPGVKAVAPALRRRTILYHNGKRAKLLVFGIDPVRDAAMHNYELQAGRIFEPSADEAASTPVLRRPGYQGGG